MAKATTEKKASKKTRKTRIAYPALKQDAAGKTTVKLKEWPADFDSKIHKRLRRADFENPAVLFRHRAEVFKARAKTMEMLAEEAEAGADTPEGKRLRALRQFAKLEQIKAQLIAEGVDVEGYLKQLAAAQG
jgi:hypothetical protein